MTRFQIHSGDLAGDMQRLVAKGIDTRVMPRIMRRDAKVFGGKRDIQKLIANRLGWVDIAGTMFRRKKQIEQFGAKIVADGFQHVVVVGMGGSSLCPETLAVIFGARKKLKSLQIIDSTDPAAIKRVEKKIDYPRTLFIVASKSGGTIETRSHAKYFRGRLVALGVKNPGRQFVAITDPGSELAEFGKRLKYRKVILNPSDIGGRYSALSYFGLLPASLTQANVAKLLQSAVDVEKEIADRTDESNPALQLGALMAAGARKGRNKLTFVATKSLAPLVPWIEQLVAESTGKKGKGVVPIEAEPVESVENLSDDRILVLLTLGKEKLPKGFGGFNSDVPAVVMALDDRHQIGEQFVLWEAATAACGYFLEINPFDEPNVTESKENTKKLLDLFQKTGQFSMGGIMATKHSLQLVATTVKAGRNGNQVASTLKAFFNKLAAPEYLSILSYAASEPGGEKTLVEIRRLVRGKRGVATLRGYGPRFLHSIGQLYKGGPKQGAFIVLMRDGYPKLAIPDAPFTFGDLITAQALGDSQALMKRNLPVLVLSFTGSLTQALNELHALSRDALR